jgi:hypothetical protein
VFEGFRTAGEIIQALHIYDNNRSRAAATGRLYGGFVRRGNLVFDVGDSAASFCRLLVDIERCIALGYTRFKAALSERQAFLNADWVDGEATVNWLTGWPHASNSGDNYATLA